MSVRRRDLERALVSAERSVQLVERCLPCNLLEEHARLLGAWQRGDADAPQYTYAPGADLSELRQSLESVAEHAGALGPWGELYADRAQELALEAELAALAGQAGFAQAAARRHPVEPGEDGRRAEAWAREWSTAIADSSTERAIASEDEADPESLVCQMRRAVGARRLPFRVVLRKEMLSAAATGDNVIVVRAGVRHRSADTRRIVLHEVYGHALPRSRAHFEALGLFALGTRGGADDEEGRALLLEKRAGCLGTGRKAELGRRHLACAGVRAGADFVETVRMLLASGCSLEESLGIAARAHRGGGLGREIGI